MVIINNSPFIPINDIVDYIIDENAMYACQASNNIIMMMICWKDNYLGKNVLMKLLEKIP